MSMSEEENAVAKKGVKGLGSSFGPVLKVFKTLKPYAPVATATFSPNGRCGDRIWSFTPELYSPFCAGGSTLDATLPDVRPLVGCLSAGAESVVADTGSAVECDDLMIAGIKRRSEERTTNGLKQTVVSCVACLGTYC